MNRVLPAALVAIGAGAGFGNPLFSLPALTSLRYRSIELTWLLLPTVAAVMLAIAIAAAPRFRGRGYLLTAVGALVGGLGIFLADERIGGASATVAWVLVTAASGGLAAGGLAVAAGCVSGPERLAIGAGLAAGIAASSPVLGLPRAESWPGFLVHLAVFVLAVVLAWRQEPPRAASGTIGVVVAVGVIVMAGLVARSAAVEELGPGSWARYSALGVAALAGLVLAWHAGSLGGLDLARWPVLGFALAVPVTTLVSGASTPTSALDFAVPMGAAIAGATLAATLDRLAPWEAFGGFAAAAGLALGESLLTLGGTAFALGAGLTRTAALPAGGAGIALGLAGMLLSAQALGPVTLEMLSFTGPAATAVAALVIVVLFALYRPTDRLSRELLTQAA